MMSDAGILLWSTLDFGSFRSCKEIQLMSQQEPLEVFGIIKMADQFDDTSWPNRLWNEDLNDILTPSLICHIWIKLFLGSKPRQTRKGLKHSFIKISKLIMWKKYPQKY